MRKENPFCYKGFFAYASRNPTRVLHQAIPRRSVLQLLFARASEVFMVELELPHRILSLLQVQIRGPMSQLVTRSSLVGPVICIKTLFFAEALWSSNCEFSIDPLIFDKCSECQHAGEMLVDIIAPKSKHVNPASRPAIIPTSHNQTANEIMDFFLQALFSEDVIPTKQTQRCSRARFD